ncbi:amino acid adenylation domain-containing protein [Lentzea alba]|uniref:amino acid adenylation domain-containing protein n=1 Tax=Lentzea alba TaxID=2714351 RepID=UPI0039BEE0E8
MTESHALSFAQERLWFIDAAAPAAPTYNVPLLLTWREEVDVPRLTAALHAVAAKHEVLRTTYSLSDGRPVQIVGEPSVSVEVVSGVANVRADALHRAQQGFDLAAAPPIRCTLWPGEPDLLLINVHHIAIDGWSLAAFFDDLAVAYAGGELAPLMLQYKDFAVADRSTFDSPKMRELVARRVEELREFPADLTLGSPRPAAGPVRPGEQHVFEIPDDLWDRAGELARSLRATPFVVLFAAYQAVLQRWSGRDEFVVGTVTANRSLADAEQLVGFFVNTVPLRCLVDPEQTFSALCKEVRVEAFKSLTYQGIPFDQLAAQGVRGMVDVGFALQNMPAPKTDAPWRTPELLPTGTAKFDLILIVEDDAEGRRGRIEFATDQYSAEMARHLGDNFLALLRAAVDAPETPVCRLPLTGGSVVHGAPQDLGGTTSVLDVVGRGYAPDAAAVSVAGDSVTWAELDSWAWAVADRVPGGFVPVLAARGPALVAGWLGALRAGAAYAPLSLDTPADRLDHVLAELNAGVVLADQAGADLIARHGTDVEVVRIEDHRTLQGTPRTVDLIGQEPAVVIYTSGTTGRPKGVLVPHSGMLNTCVWWARDIDLGPGDRVLCTWSTSFDGATHEVFRALIAGAELVFADDVERRDPPALARLLREVTVTSMTPSLLRAILDADQDGPTTLRTLYVGGEGLPVTLAEECTRRWGVPMRNIYGPTEASCISTFAPVSLDGRPPAIGVPVPNTRAYVLGPRQEELPDGVPGELCVAGAGVALGYLGQPERTEAAFLLDPLGGRMYRTGDRVVLRGDGQIEYLGRVDDQVKVLGNRIELGEVRKLLEEQPSVKTAAVKAEGTPLRLVAWVELAGVGRVGGEVDSDAVEPASAVPTRDELLKPLLRWLPAAVLPAEVYVVDAIPMTGNDKMDFTALDALRSAKLPDVARGTVELTPDQRKAAELFAAALERDADELPPDGDFFTLGGHSLLAVRMLADTPVALRDFLADPTVAGLGALLGTTTHHHVEVVGDEHPATSVQQRFWFIDRVKALRTAYLAPVIAEFTGEVDVERLRAATELVLGRHPALRSRFTLNAKQRKIFYRTDGSAPEVHVTDATQWSEEELKAHLAQVCWTPFDLATEAPAYGEIVTTNERTLLVLVTHHIVADGWSHQVLADQISQVYQGQSIADPVHPASVTTTETAADEIIASLAEAPTDVELPHDRERGPVQNTEAKTRTTTLPAEITAKLQNLGSTTFMITAAITAVALARKSSQRDFLFAFPWAGRDKQQHAVGMFVNTLILRVDLRDEPTWRQLLDRVREHSTTCYRNADVPFDAIATALHPGRDLSRPALTPVYVTALPGKAEPPDLNARARYLTPEPLHIKYELELTATDSAELELSLAYATALFDESTVDQLLDGVVTAATDLAIDPDAPALKEI